MLSPPPGVGGAGPKPDSTAKADLATPKKPVIEAAPPTNDDVAHLKDWQRTILEVRLRRQEISTFLERHRLQELLEPTTGLETFEL